MRYTQADGERLVARVRRLLALGADAPDLERMYRAFQADEAAQTDEAFEAMLIEVERLEGQTGDYEIPPPPRFLDALLTLEYPGVLALAVACYAVGIAACFWTTRP